MCGVFESAIPIIASFDFWVIRKKSSDIETRCGNHGYCFGGVNKSNELTKIGGLKRKIDSITEDLFQETALNLEL